MNIKIVALFCVLLTNPTNYISIWLICCFVIVLDQSLLQTNAATLYDVPRTILTLQRRSEKVACTDRKRVPGLDYRAREWGPKIAPYAYEDLRGVGQSISCVFLERPDLL